MTDGALRALPVLEGKLLGRCRSLVQNSQALLGIGLVYEPLHRADSGVAASSMVFFRLAVILSVSVGRQRMHDLQAGCQVQVRLLARLLRVQDISAGLQPSLAVSITRGFELVVERHRLGLPQRSHTRAPAALASLCLLAAGHAWGFISVRLRPLFQPSSG